MRGQWIDEIMGRLDLKQKVGQLLVFGFCGPVITPDVVELVRDDHIGGLRISQKFRTMNLFNDVKPGSEPEDWVLRSLARPEGANVDYAWNWPCTTATPAQYAGALNRLREVALERSGGVPLHFVIDQEGSASDDILCGQRLMPHPMGFAAAGEPELAYRAARAIGRQVRALGVNMIHSPVLDVNTNPKNPEIGTRAYSDDPNAVIEYATASFRGFRDSGLIATGKHFAGRGESVSDAHWGLPSVDLDRETLDRVHLRPFKALVDDGIPAIMVAHCLYPALGVTEEPSSCSRGLITDYLRGELGFEGVVTTDNMMMGGLLQKYELTEAALRTLQAGCDLVLLRDESPIRQRIAESLVEAVRDGRLPESEVDEKVQRILGMRYDMGLADGGGVVDAAKAAEPIDAPDVVETAREAAEKSVLELRDGDSLLPLDPGAKVLLVEQIFPTHAFANTMDCHPGMLWDEMLRVSGNVLSVEIPNRPSDDDRRRVMRRVEVDDPDVIVTTNYYYHKAAAAVGDLVRDLRATGKPVVVVTNTPYALATEDFPTVVTSFNPGGREHLRAVAELLYGQLRPTARVPVAELG